MEEKSGKFSNGLVWGAILGGSLVFLLGTKKGKKILQNIVSTGLEIIEGLNSASQDEYFEDEQDATEQESASAQANDQSAQKRFFRGVKKKN